MIHKHGATGPVKIKTIRNQETEIEDKRPAKLRTRTFRRHAALIVRSPTTVSVRCHHTIIPSWRDVSRKKKKIIS